MAPEYAIDEQVTTSSDLYALGCVIYAVHLGGRPPFQNHNSLSTLRQNAERVSRGDIGSSAAMGRLGNDLRGEQLSLWYIHPKEIRLVTNCA
jgi:SCY1-like protein 2